MNTLQTQQINEMASTPEMEDQLGAIVPREELLEIWHNASLKELKHQPKSEYWKNIRDRTSNLLKEEK